MEFDETPRFWYSRVALDAWTDFGICSYETYGPIFLNIIEKRRKKKKNLILALALLPSPFFLFDFYVFFFIFFLIYFFFLVLSFPLFHPLDTWLNVSHSHKCTTCHAMCHPTPDVSKNMKFRLSRNSTKFDRVTRFHEKNSMVKFVSSSKI